MFKQYQKTALIALAVFLLLIDRFLKVLAWRIVENDTVHLLGDWLTFHLVRNYFISLSIPLGGPLIIFLTMAIIAGIIFYWQRKWKRLCAPEFLALSLILAGALSNLYDRLVYGFVIDYFDFKYLFVNNLADIIIFGGVVLLLFGCKNSKV